MDERTPDDPNGIPLIDPKNPDPKLVDEAAGYPPPFSDNTHVKHLAGETAGETSTGLVGLEKPNIEPAPYTRADRPTLAADAMAAEKLRLQQKDLPPTAPK